MPYNADTNVGSDSNQYVRTKFEQIVKLQIMLMEKKNSVVGDLFQVWDIYHVFMGNTR